MFDGYGLICYYGFMSYNATPADKIFPSIAVILRGERKQDPETREWDFSECIFYADYLFGDKSISIGVFDDVTRSYLVETKYVKTLNEAVAMVQAIDMEYPGKIEVKKLVSKFKLFFRVCQNAVAISTPVTDTNDTCEQCNDSNVDTLDFLYVPALDGSSFKEGSLDIHWEYGCYGGTVIEGSSEMYLTEAYTLLKRAKSMASSKSYQLEIQKAIDSLRFQDSEDLD